MIVTFHTIKAARLPGEQRDQYGKVFLLALLTSALVFLPSVIVYGGWFFFSGDFNVQQIPFYQMGNRAVQSGDIFWTWTTDLGANFITSYSFYMAGSPFFWLSCLFPSDWTPYLMAPLLALKTACAATTGYMFIKRFCKNQNFAALGGLLYAFSGWATYNIFFNHFHEPLVFFPLLLVGLEELVLNGRKGVFALAVAINAIVSYFFFAGQVTFVVLYFFLRFSDKNWRLTLRRFLAVAFEAVCGTLLAAFILVPSVIVVLNNPRTTSHASGFNLLFYDRVQRYGYILQSMFFPPELPARLNFFPDAGSRWSSVAAWLPFFSMTGVIAFVRARKKHWISRLLLTCLAMSLVPVLNSMFVMLNSSYYARWFYMPVLIMALATVKSLSEAEHGYDIKGGLIATTVVTAIFTVAIGLLPQREGESFKLGLYENPERFWGYVVIAFYCLLMFFVIWKSYRGKPNYHRLLIAGTLLTSVIYSVFFLISGTIGSEEATFIQTTTPSSAAEMGLPTDYFWRMDVDGETMDNQGFFWNIPNIQCFQSVVPASIMEFYPMVGVTRDVGSRPDQSQYALRGLLSVKYLFIAEEDVNKEEEPVACTMPGFEYYDTQNQFEIYENTEFVPMGFAYDRYLTVAEFEDMTENQRCSVLMQAIVLTEEQAAEYADVLVPIENPDSLMLTQEQYEADCASRRSQCCYAFETDTNGFTARCDMENDELVFFSVPWEEGAWTATVNGRPAEVEKVSVGFLAVRVPAGEAVIRVDYETPGLKLGVSVSGCAAAALIVYLGANRLLDRRRRRLAPAAQAAEATAAEVPNEAQNEAQTPTQTGAQNEAQTPTQTGAPNETQTPPQTGSTGGAETPPEPAGFAVREPRAAKPDETNEMNGSGGNA